MEIHSDEILEVAIAMLPANCRTVAKNFLIQSWEIVGNPPAEVSIKSLRAEFNAIERCANKLFGLPTVGARNNSSIQKTITKLNRLLVAASAKYASITGDIVFAGYSLIYHVMASYPDGLANANGNLQKLMRKLSWARPAMDALQESSSSKGNRSGQLLAKLHGKPIARFVAECATVWFLVFGKVPGGSGNKFTDFAGYATAGVTNQSDISDMERTVTSVRRLSNKAYNDRNYLAEFLRNARYDAQIKSGVGPIADRGSYLIAMRKSYIMAKGREIGLASQRARAAHQDQRKKDIADVLKV